MFTAAPHASTSAQGAQHAQLIQQRTRITVPTHASATVTGPAQLAGGAEATRWAALLRHIARYRDANESGKNEAYNTMYTAAIAYMKVKFPRHERLAQEEAPTNNVPVVPDAGGRRRSELDRAVAAFGSRGRINTSITTLPDIIVAILNFRPHVPRPDLSVTHADTTEEISIQDTPGNAGDTEPDIYWQSLATATHLYTGAPAKHQIRAYNTLYDAVILYMRKAHPDHPRLATELARRYDAPLQADENNTRQLALAEEVQGFARKPTRRNPFPAPRVPEGEDLPTLVTAVLDLRPCVPRRNAPDAQAGMKPPAQFAPIPVLSVPLPPQPLKLLLKIAKPTWLPDFLARDIANPRGGPMAALKQYLAEPHAGLREYINQRPVRDGVLIELCRILVQDADARDDELEETVHHPEYALRFKETHFEKQLMRLLARYLSPDTTEDFGNLHLSPFMQQLHDDDANPQIVVSAEARMKILIPLLGASHHLGTAGAYMLLSIALDNVEDVRKIGSLPERLTLLGAIARAYHTNYGLVAGSRATLSSNEMKRIANVTAEIADTLVQMREQGTLNRTTVPLSALQGLAEDLRLFNTSANAAAGNANINAYPQMPEAYRHIEEACMHLEADVPESFEVVSSDPPPPPPVWSYADLYPDPASYPDPADFPNTEGT